MRLRILLALGLALVMSTPAVAQRWDGFNIIAVPGHPYGSESAAAALQAARHAGATAVTIVPFLWQGDPQHAGLVRGADMSDDELRAAIRQVHQLGLKAIVKPHVWVQGGWAGSVEPQSPDDWRAWFQAYREALLPIARIASEEGAEMLSIGTELEKTTQRPEWAELIDAVRPLFAGLLTYSAHNVEEAEAVPFWGRLDLIGVTLYPPLGDDADHAAWRSVMQAVAARLDALSQRAGKPVLVAEVGIRSARGAARKPWESVEERTAEPDPDLQKAVLDDWMEALDRPSVTGVLVWEWLTDPNAGGMSDTDFTVQGKPAERVLCKRVGACGD